MVYIYNKSNKKFQQYAAVVASYRLSTIQKYIFLMLTPQYTGI